MDLWDTRSPSGPAPEQRHDKDALTPVAPQSEQHIDLGAGITGTHADAEVYRSFYASGFEGIYGAQWEAAYTSFVRSAVEDRSAALSQLSTSPETFGAVSRPHGSTAAAQLAAALGGNVPGLSTVYSGGLIVSDADTLGADTRARAHANALELDALLRRDPDALLEFPPGIPRDQLVARQRLALKTASPSFQRDIASWNASLPADRIPGNPHPVHTDQWQLRDVQHAQGGSVNMDYFAVTVSRLPNGFRTPEQLLEHISKNINDFTNNPGISSFQPYPGPKGQDWNTDNPEGSIVAINIPVDPGGGSVAVIESRPDHWTFQTIHSPGQGGHPVSGNRQFGFTINEPTARNPTASYTFYTMGVDRMTNGFASAINTTADVVGSAFGAESLTGRNGGGFAFDGPDRLWDGFRNNIEHFVDSHGGAAAVRPATARPHGDTFIARPRWGDNNVQAVLSGIASVDSLNLPQ